MEEELLNFIKKYLVGKEVDSKTKNVELSREKIIGVLNSSKNSLLEGVIILESLCQDYFDLLISYLVTSKKANDLCYYSLFKREEINKQVLFRTQLAKIIEEILEEKVDKVYIEPKHTISTNLSKRFDVIAKTGFKCYYCGREAPEVELQLEHFVPRAKGGSDDVENLFVACRDCNAGKRDKIIQRDDGKN